MKRAVLTGAVLLGMVLPLAAQDPHAGHAQEPAAKAAAPDNPSIPPDNGASSDRLKASPRHQAQNAANAAADAWPLTIAFLKKQTQ
jgi:hypothetical protein